MSDSRESAASELVKFCSAEGHQVIHSLVDRTLKYDPHDYIVDGVAHLLDGTDLLAVLPTGGGKTDFYSVFMLVMLALAKKLPMARRYNGTVPDNPALILVLPTIGLEEEMATKLESLGLKTVVINAHTKAKAWKDRRENLWETARSGAAVIILSPEMLASDGFETLVQDAGFCARVCALGVDEVHLCNSWGVSFRKAFTQIGFARARLSEKAVLILTTATLAAGRATDNIRSFFGLHTGHFHLIRRSNLRPEIQIIFRTLSQGPKSLSFPDFDWILVQKRKTIIFCPTIQHGDRILQHLRNRSPRTSNPKKRIRMYTSLFYPEYNAATLELFRTDAEAQVIVATDALVVGINLLNVQDVILSTTPEDTDKMLQQIGRVGRDASLVPDPRGIVYLTKQASQTARKLVDQYAKNGESAGTSKVSGDGNKKEMDMGIARMILAPCKTAAQNELYSNPPSDDPCSCSKCSAPPSATPSPCRCSGCMPEPDSHGSAPKKSRKTDHGLVPRKDRLSRKMRAAGTARLLSLRNTLYHEAGAKRYVLPPYIFLPDPLIKQILDRFALLKVNSDLDALLEARTYVKPLQDKLWTVVEELQITFARIKIEDAALKKERDRQRKAEKATKGDAQKVDDEGSDSSADESDLYSSSSCEELESEDEVLPPASWRQPAAPRPSTPPAITHDSEPKATPMTPSKMHNQSTKRAAHAIEEPASGKENSVLRRSQRRKIG